MPKQPFRRCSRALVRWLQNRPWARKYADRIFLRYPRMKWILARMLYGGEQSLQRSFAEDAGAEQQRIFEELSRRMEADRT